MVMSNSVCLFNQKIILNYAKYALSAAKYVNQISKSRNHYKRIIKIIPVRNFKDYQSIICVTTFKKYYSTKITSGGLIRRYSDDYQSKITIPVRENPAIMKLDNPDFHAIFTPELQTLLDVFTRHGYELRIAGGAVRDLLSGIRPTDLDFATTATPAQMRAMFEEENIRMLSTTGEKHGTITPRINDKANFEITTLRVDIETDGRHAKVEFTTNWMLDANRRDLTINSMFLGLDGTVYDHFHGYDDLKEKRVIFVGNADNRIKEDYLRILRYFRFYGRICDDPDKHDPEVLGAIKKNAEGLKQISGERIWMELSKILVGNFAGELILKMLDLGLAPYIGLPNPSDVEEFLKVWERSKNNNMKPMTLLSALIRNGKEMEKFHARTKLSTNDRNLGYFLISQRKFVLPTDVNPMKVLLTHMVREIKNNHRIKEHIIELLKYHNHVDLIKNVEDCIIPKCPVNGNDMIEAGVPNGKTIRYAIDMLKANWIKSGFQLTKEELIELLPGIMKLLNEELIRPKKSKLENNS